jgi:hypothetical protein
MKRLEVSMGFVQFDDKELQVGSTMSAEDAVGGLTKAIFKVGKLMTPGVQTQESTNKSVRLDLITSIQLTWLTAVDSRTAMMAKLGGSKIGFPIGTLKISTAGGGPDGAFQLGILEGGRNDAEVFVDELKQAVAAFSRPAQAPAVDAGPTKTCPDCAEDVKEAASKCRFCGYMFAG